MNDMQKAAAEWDEYDACADWCAVRGLTGDYGDPLPEGISSRCQSLIDDDPEAFADRVRGFRYARAMRALEKKYPDDLAR